MWTCCSRSSEKHVKLADLDKGDWPRERNLAVALKRPAVNDDCATNEKSSWQGRGVLFGKKGIAVVHKKGLSLFERWKLFFGSFLVPLFVRGTRCVINGLVR
ncbi:hypothetical protein AVEN_254019-1 [Araneus ventricosus]|uniref:Uncharacterized protein n=1 Tax=Araneus ventricosus TaxID=182803 RepID=A0A4Y2E854_ARAVE|nr:hypothetical protein AVEN_254019-1 [Araneus ventricosus]